MSENPFDTAAPGQSVPAAAPSVDSGNPFGAPGGDMADPFAAPANTGGGAFPRPQDLVGRVVALRKISEKEEENPFSQKTPKDLQKVFYCHLVVFTGGTITTSDRREDAPLDAPPVEVGEPIYLLQEWKIYNAGLLNKFGRNNIIRGRIVQEPLGKQAKETLNTWQKVEAFKATNPSRDVLDKAKLFWTLIDDLTPEETKLTLDWIRGGSVEAKEFMA
jgi:hypothetical protein